METVPIGIICFLILFIFYIEKLIVVRKTGTNGPCPLGNVRTYVYTVRRGNMKMTMIMMVVVKMMLMTITMMIMIMIPTWQCADASVDATQFVASLSFPLSGNISRESLSSICATFSIPRPRIIFSRDSIHDYFSPDSTALPRMSALAYHKIYHRPKKNSIRRKKLMKKWILVQNWRSPLGASLASSSRLFVHFGQKEIFTSSVFTFLHFVHFGQKKVFFFTRSVFTLLSMLPFLWNGWWIDLWRKSKHGTRDI